jgi:hypothetical protein
MKQLINDEVQELQSALESIMFSHHQSRRLVIPEISGFCDLEYLLRTIFDEKKGRTERLGSFISKFSSEFVVRVFALAALQQWVFMAEIPDLQSSDNRMLEAYRQEVFNQGELSLYKQFSTY